MKSLLTALKMRYSRGSSWLQILLNLGIITANIKLFEDFFKIWLGLNSTVLIIIAIPLYIIVCYGIGFFDEKKGIWKSENDYSFEMTPAMRDTISRVKEIHDVMCKKD